MTTAAKYYRAFRVAYPKIPALRAWYVAREAVRIGPQKDRVRFEFPDATEAERGALFRENVRPASVYWRPSEYTEHGHGLEYRHVIYNPRTETLEGRSFAHVRFIEKGAAGLRFAGYADEIAKAEGRPRSIDHTGWIADPYGDGHPDFLYRGVVYRLPARNGRSVFVYGYADPNGTGRGLLCFDNDADSEMEAARYADGFAERMAEHEREYQTKELASMRIEECKAAVKEVRDEMREIRAELKAARARCKRFPSAERPRALVRAVKAQLESMRRSVTEYRAEAERLADNPFSILER